MSVSRLLPTLVLGLALGACNDDENGQQGTVRTDAGDLCGLVSAADIENVTGEATEPGEARNGLYCVYFSVAHDEAGMPVHQVIVRPELWPTGVVAAVTRYQAMMREGLAENADSFIATSIDGLGDAALRVSYLGITEVVAFVGSGGDATTLLHVQPDGFEAGSSLDYAEALAAIAVGRL